MACAVHSACALDAYVQGASCACARCLLAQVRNEFNAAMAQSGGNRGSVIVPYYLGIDAAKGCAFYISFVPPGSRSGAGPCKQPQVPQ